MKTYINMLKTTTLKAAVLVFFTVLFAQKISAQGTIPGIYVVGLVNFPDTAYEGQIYTQIGVTFLNSDTNIFTGPITAYIKGDSSVVDTLFTSSQTTINANDSVTFFTSNGFMFDPSTFRQGSNIVVVWPVANGVLSPDTLVDSVYYVRLNTLNPVISSIETFDAYPNPVNKYLTVLLPGNSVPESVRISDVSGRLIFEDVFAAGREVNLSMLGRGYYFVQVTDRKGNRYISKILKNE